MHHALNRSIFPDMVAQEGDVSTEEVIQTDITCDNGGAVCDLVLEWTGNEVLANATSLLGTLLKVALIVLLAFVVNRLSRRAISRITARIEAPDDASDAVLVSEKSAERAEERAQAIGTVLRSAVTFVVYLVAAIMILDEFGINLGPVLASAGIGALAIGFGAQSLVEDFLSGLSMLVEDQFGVGDRVDLGEGTVGHVERITLRTTSVRDNSGGLWHVPNGQIDRAVNLSQQWSLAVVDVGVAYEADLGQAEDVLESTVRGLAEDTEWSERIVGNPEVQGVQELGADAVILRVRVRTSPGVQSAVERELRARVKQALDGAGIEMPYPGLTVYLRDAVPVGQG